MSIPELHTVESSNIAAIGYADDDLYVQYKSGAIYRYRNVPKFLYEDFLVAESKGKFMNLNIKGSYDYDYLR